MNEVTISQIENFIKMYRAASLPQRFERLKQGYQEVQRLSRLKAPEFNIFRVLQIDQREVKTHSAFLAELLNQHGSHGQQFLFLKTFLSYCQKYQSFPNLQLDNLNEASQWEIRTELHIDKYGRMDIVIRSTDSNFLCVIENKVDAYEGDRQLQSYWDWMNSQRGKYGKQALIFLTPDGRESSAFVPCFKFSYRRDIYAWLEATLPLIEAEPVQVVVQQYLQLILTL